MADILVTNEWQSLNTLSSTVVGTELQIQNKGSSHVVLYENPTQPSADSVEGEVVATLYVDGEHTKIILEGSGEVWVRSIYNSSILSIQVL